MLTVVSRLGIVIGSQRVLNKQAVTTLPAGRPFLGTVLTQDNCRLSSMYKQLSREPARLNEILCKIRFFLRAFYPSQNWDTCSKKDWFYRLMFRGLLSVIIYSYKRLIMLSLYFITQRKFIFSKISKVL